jgi:hypothetical protein
MGNADSALEIYVQNDTLNTGLETTPMLDEAVPALRVSWIKWNSGFRGSGLEIADQIIAVNGKPIVKPRDLRELQIASPRYIGSYQESQTWTEAGAREGDSVMLTVRRRAFPGQGWRQLEIQGRLNLDRVFQFNGRRLYGPGGPDQMANEGTYQSWSSWYDEAVKQWMRILDGGWELGSFTSEYELSQHLEREPRVKMLVEKYPGPFAESVREDWERVRDSLRGQQYELAPNALAFRKLGEEQAAAVAEAGRIAREAFLKKHAANFIPCLPNLNPIADDLGPVEGKLIDLPMVTHRQWISQGSRTYLYFNVGNQWCFADTNKPGMQHILIAGRKYEKRVSPLIRSEYTIIGKILRQPSMVVINERVQVGFTIEPVAGSVGGAFFVEVPDDPGAEPLLAGEELLTKNHVQTPPDDAAPREVLETFFNALKQGDFVVWQAMFATWSVYIASNGLPVISTGLAYRMDNDWERARREILTKICDVRVVWIDDCRTVVSGTEFEGAPPIEEITIEIDFLKQYPDGTCRSFSGISMHRLWNLQRISGGPWRLTTIWGL